MSKPRKGDNIWVMGQLPQPNGTIIGTKTFDGDLNVFVKYYDTKGLFFLEYDENQWFFNTATNQWEVRGL